MITIHMIRLLWLQRNGQQHHVRKFRGFDYHVPWLWHHVPSAHNYVLRNVTSAAQRRQLDTGTAYLPKSERNTHSFTFFIGDSKCINRASISIADTDFMVNAGGHSSQENTIGHLRGGLCGRSPNGQSRIFDIHQG